MNDFKSWFVNEVENGGYKDEFPRKHVCFFEDENNTIAIRTNVKRQKHDIQNYYKLKTFDPYVYNVKSVSLTRHFGWLNEFGREVTNEILRQVSLVSGHGGRISILSDFEPEDCIPRGEPLGHVNVNYSLYFQQEGDKMTVHVRLFDFEVILGDEGKEKILKFTEESKAKKPRHA